MLDCRAIMTPISVSLYADDPLSSAIDFMMDKHMGLVPVVDRDDSFVGLLAGDQLMHAILPATLTYVRGMTRVSYLRETREDLAERLDDLRTKPIRAVVDTRVKTVHPDSPLIDALMLLSQKQHVVPVVAPDSGRLLGAISFFTVIGAVEGDK